MWFLAEKDASRDIYQNDIKLNNIVSQNLKNMMT